MRLRDLHIHAIAVPRIYNTRVAPTGGPPGGKDISQYYILEFETEAGLTGLGEVSDLEDAWDAPAPAVLRQTLLAPLVDIDLRQRRPAWDRVNDALPTDYHPEFRRLVTAAVDVGLLDLNAKHHHAPAHALLGGGCRDALPVSWVAYIRGVAELEEEIAEKVGAGFSAFKLKVGADFDLDCERIRVCRRLAGPDAYIKADASGAWEEEEAIDRIRTFSGLGVDAVETPLRQIARSVAKDRPEEINADPDAAAQALARVREAVPADIIEHVADFDEGFALALLRHAAVDVFNIVPVQAGSLHRAQRLVHIAEAGGMPVLLGSTVELGIGTAAALHLGIAAQAVTVASDLVGPGLLADDVVAPRLGYERGQLGVGTGIGLGVDLVPTQLARYGVEP